MPRLDVDPRDAHWTRPDGRPASFQREPDTMRTHGACRGKYAARIFAPVAPVELSALVGDRAHVTTAGVLDGAPVAQLIIFGGSREKIESDATKLGEMVCARFGLAEVYAEVQGHRIREARLASHGHAVAALHGWRSAVRNRATHAYVVERRRRIRRVVRSTEQCGTYESALDRGGERARLLRVRWEH